MPKWKKLGRVYVPSGEKYWMRSHAANTVPIHVSKDIVRIYFNSRDEDNRSYVSWIEVEVIGEEFRVIGECEGPVLSPGGAGYFDESGVSLGCIIEVSGVMNLYYLGWTLGKTVPWYNSIGLATLSKDGTMATRHSKAPIYSRTDEDPITVSYPFLIEEDGRFLVYYGSSKKWGREKNSMDHVLKLAETEDGVNFVPRGIEAIHPTDSTEYAFSRPFVYVDSGIWKMYYSFRGESYRIGYAESEDGVTWKRMDSDSGISVSDVESDWDSEMVCYGYLFFKDGNTYMTYSGNGYGKSGFGLAILEAA